MEPSTPQLMNLREVCRLLGLSLHTARKLVRQGRLPCFRNGRIRRFAPEHIVEFLAGRPGRGAAPGRQDH